MDVQSNSDLSQGEYTEVAFTGQSTSSFTNFEILDLEAASKNHINDADERDIEEETQNIMEEVVDKSCENLQKPSNDGIVLHIVNDKGNLKSKQILNKNDNGSNWCQKCSSYFKTSVELEEHECNHNLFECEECSERFGKLEALLCHIKESHHTTNVPHEYETLLNNQKLAIDKIEKTAYELIDVHKYDAVKNLLETSKNSLDNFNVDIFGKSNCNVFTKYVENMYKRIYNDLNDQGTKKRARKKLQKKLINDAGVHKKSLRKKSKKVSSKKHSKKLRKDYDDGDNDFSSDDDLCLKDCVLKAQENIENKDEDGPLYLQFYATPYKTSGKPISLYEISCMRAAIKNMWDGIHIDISSFSDVMVNRYEREIDEVLPDDTLFSGYASKENKAIFQQPKRFVDLFDENLLLNDGIRPHKVNNITKDYNVSGGINTHGEDIFEKFPEDLSESDDSYDDGFDKATEYLMQIPDPKRTVLGSTKYKCEICNKECHKKKLLLKHMNENHMEMWTRYVCKVCNSTFLPRARLWKHFSTHTQLTMQECELCCETFISLDDKNTHIDKMHFSDLFICPLCNCQYEDLSSLREHFKTKHIYNSTSDLEPGQPTCTKCHREFTSQGRLVQHMSSAHQGKKSKKKKR